MHELINSAYLTKKPIVNIGFFVCYNKKTSLKAMAFLNGASEENRTPISALARPHINHYTTPAYVCIIYQIIAFCASTI